MSSKKYRLEHFGGIVGIHEPPALVFVDRKYMQGAGFSDSALWHSGQRYLSAPTEVHFSITGKCPLHCQHCTADSGELLDGEMTTAEIKRAIDILAEMKVFHIAFGGGELFTRPDVIELAEYARAIERSRPRFIVGVGALVWTQQGQMVRIQADMVPFLQDRYRPCDARGFVWERKQ